MGVLDEAIREHLDLKRRQGADEAEIKSIEDEAFGSVGDVQLEATEVAAAGPEAGDQLDKVFEQARKAEEEAQQTESPGSEAVTPVPASPREETRPEPVAGDSDHGPGEPEAESSPEAAVEVEQETRIIEPADVPDELAGDAGDALEMERQNLAGHPTENYDVDAAIAEEVELDQLSESRLSEELDRALDSPSAEEAPPEPAAEPEAAVVEEVEQSEVVEETPLPDPDPGPESLEVELEETEVTVEEPTAEPPIDDSSPDEADSPGESEEAGNEFFDQENPLEGTPDFLEENPESESLWFEQKDPGDFDFGD